ncbi:MAG: hypothetical protein COA78_27100 [Blastopirellula sp.]|nr:MAG: hypothetical protein COA78_27100 [Blastopirellula sp.]
MWTDEKGHTLEGDYVRLTGENEVVLLVGDNEYTIPLDRFAEADQDYVRNQAELKVAAARVALHEIREWTSTTGKKIKAKFVRMHEGRVILIVGHRAVRGEFSKFSEEDQGFLRTNLEAMGRGDQIPSKIGDIEPAIEDAPRVAEKEAELETEVGDSNRSPKKCKSRCKRRWFFRISRCR